ncbi:MAG: response regulator transcription factor [Candidatus Binataceae bacterium]
MKHTKTSIVLVDDDVPFLRALRRLIGLAGFRATAFNRAEDVLRARLPKRHGCIVLDLFLPEMDAVELFQRLRAAGNQLPVILITGRQDDHSQRLINQIDHIAVLYKPFAASELLEAIAKTGPRGASTSGT